jgi:hypothetical protein
MDPLPTRRALAVPAPEVKVDPAVWGPVARELGATVVVVGVDQEETSRVAVVDLQLVAAEVNLLVVAVERHPAAAEGMARAAAERAAATILMLAVARAVAAAQTMAQQRTA